MMQSHGHPVEMPMQYLKGRQYAWHHIHITIEDRSAAAGWYREAVGARRAEPTPRSENLWFDRNLIQIQSEEVAADSVSRFHSIGFSVEDLDASLRKLVDAGATIIQRHQKMALLADPFGTSVELVAADRDCQSHVNIVCDDPSVHASWYAEMFDGVRVECPWDESRQAVRWCTETVCFLQNQNKAQRKTNRDKGRSSEDRAIDHIGWYVLDLEKSYEELSARDVTFPVPPTPFGAVRLAFLKDPGGIWIELLEPADPNDA